MRKGRPLVETSGGQGVASGAVPPWLVVGDLQVEAEFRSRFEPIGTFRMGRRIVHGWIAP